MKSLAFLFTAILFFTPNSYSTWYPQNSGTNVTLNSVYFPALNTGYIAGNNGTILKTNDRGASWVQKPSGTTNNLKSVYFLNANTGFAAGDHVILKTNDGCNTWSHYTAGINFELRSVYFINENTGYAAGMGGAVVKTINGGQSWQVNVISQTATFTSVNFINSNTGYVVGLGAAFYKTIDGGNSWAGQHTFTTKNYYYIQFLNQNTGYIVGGWVNCTLIRSDDGGESWISLLGGGTGVRLYSGSFIDEENGYAAGRYGTIWKTVDAGASWVSENSGTSAYLYGIHYINSQTAYAVGESGVIRSTISVIGIKPVSGNIPEKFSLYQNYPNPFNPNTKIRFDIPQKTNVKLNIYNILGEEVAILLNQGLKPDIYEADFDGANLPSGVYFYKLSAGDFTVTKKMILAK